MTSTPMAVVAPDLTSAPAVQAAHVPDIHPQHSDDEANGAAQPKKGGAKRIASSDEEDEKPLAKKPRASAVAARRKVIDSDSESEEDAPVRIFGLVRIDGSGIPSTGLTAHIYMHTCESSLRFAECALLTISP